MHAFRHCAAQQSTEQCVMLHVLHHQFTFILYRSLTSNDAAIRCASRPTNLVYLHRVPLVDGNETPFSITIVCSWSVHCMHTTTEITIQVRRRRSSSEQSVPWEETIVYVPCMRTSILTIRCTRGRCTHWSMVTEPFTGKRWIVLRLVPFCTHQYFFTWHQLLSNCRSSFLL